MSREVPRSATVLLILVLFTSMIVGTFTVPVKAAPQAVVTIADSYYSPQEVTIVVGSTVLWKNTGSLSHTATSDSSLWDSGPIPAGGSYQSPVFNKVGVFNYHSSSPDVQMTGKIIVVSSNAVTIYPGTVDSGLVASYIIALMFAVLVIFWLNYPSAKSQTRVKMR